MRVKLLQIWQNIRASYWFVPSIMALSAFFLAWLMTSVDAYIKPELLSNVFFIYLNQPDGARSLLSTVAGSMITVAGVTFSITMVVLSLASQQFGPRLLRNFMRDTANQVVLGTFIATFLYCLLVLRTVRTAEDSSFVPHLAILMAVVMTIFSLGVFIYFIHHTAQSIQVSTIVASIATEMRAMIKKHYGEKQLFPGQLGQADVSELALLKGYVSNPFNIPAHKSGYLQVINNEGLMAFAQEKDVVIKLEHEPGDFIHEGSKLLSLYYRDTKTLSMDDVEARIFDDFAIGNYRTHSQDLDFLFDQLSEIALRALSPGINDPYTAMSCIDRLTDGFLHLLGRELPSSLRFDKEGKLRVIVPALSLESLFRKCFSPIRQCGMTSLLVNQKLLRSLFLIYEVSSDKAFKNLVRAEAWQIKQDACQHLSPQDCQDIGLLYDRFEKGQPIGETLQSLEESA
ncbi:MAG: DUF2254 domain-containing protein [Trueperaceae bacterium]|nr:DUF2254 domain-containing protein [Trueperaceae bacterium]